MTTTFERSDLGRQGMDDDTSKHRLAQEAGRDHRDRLAAVRVIAAYSADAVEARDLLAMLGLSATEVREARRGLRSVTAAGAA